MMPPKLATAIATVGWVGYAPKAPGTVGSFVGLLLAWPLLALGGLPALLLGAVLVTLVGWWAADAYEHHSGKHDPKEIVVDEVAGQWIALLVGVLVKVAITVWVVEARLPVEMTGGQRTSFAEGLDSMNHLLRDAVMLATQHPAFLLTLSVLGLLAFAAFRLFDIWKPGPIGWLDRRVQGGLGTMLDDVLAGVFAGVLVGFLWSLPVLYFVW